MTWVDWLLVAAAFAVTALNAFFGGWDVLDTDTVTAILDNLDTCGVLFNGSFVDHDGDEHDVSTIEASLTDLSDKVRRLRQLLAWAKTIPAAE